MKPARYLLACILMVITLVWFGVTIWPDLRVQWALQIYPHAKRVSAAYGYYGANAGLKVLYFWTADAIDDVKGYYEKLTYPFVLQDNNSLLSVFSVDGSKLVAKNVDGTQQEIDYLHNPRCHYTTVYRCVNISLFKVSKPLNRLPDLVGKPVSSSNRNATPYLVGTLNSGTLIVYSYYVADY